jgi:Endomembrane protein 70
VFRFPENSLLFCSAVGAGNHLLLSTFLLLILALFGMVSMMQRGSFVAGVIVSYCLTSSVSSYTSVRLYRQMGHQDTTRCTILTGALVPVPVAVVFLWVNSIALARESTAALPLSTLLTVIAMFIFISVPLTLTGTWFANSYASDAFDAPTSTSTVAREIPITTPRYRDRLFQFVRAGIIPYCVIYIELHYIFAAVWGHHIYTLFGILLLVFILLIIVASIVTIALLYFQLSREDHRWWWVSYINGGMTGLFIYAYSFYYYFNRTEMTGLLQASFFFGYMLVVSYGFFLMLGAAAFQFSLVFVRYMYSNIKCD